MHRSRELELLKHLEVVGGLRVLVTGDDLWCHPVWRPNERVPPSYCPVQLGRNAKVHYRANTFSGYSPQFRVMCACVCV